MRGAGRGKVEITVIDVTGAGNRQCPVNVDRGRVKRVPYMVKLGQHSQK